MQYKVQYRGDGDSPCGVQDITSDLNWKELEPDFGMYPAMALRAILWGRTPGGKWVPRKEYTRKGDNWRQKDLAKELVRA